MHCFFWSRAPSINILHEWLGIWGQLGLWFLLFMFSPITSKNYEVYKCKEQVKSLQSANPPRQKPQNRSPLHEYLFSTSCIKLITYNKLLVSFHFISSIKNQHYIIYWEKLNELPFYKFFLKNKVLQNIQKILKIMLAVIQSMCLILGIQQFNLMLLSLTMKTC